MKQQSGYVVAVLSGSGFGSVEFFPNREEAVAHVEKKGAGKRAEFLVFPADHFTDPNAPKPTVRVIEG